MSTCITETWLRNNGVALLEHEAHVQKIPLAHTYVCLTPDGRGKLAQTQRTIRQLQEQYPDARWYICANKDLEKEIQRIITQLDLALLEVQP